MCWLFMLNHCPTRDRLLFWSLTTNPKCLLYNASTESQTIFTLISLSPWSFGDWLQVDAGLILQETGTSLLLLSNSQMPIHHRKIVILAWQCTIYLFWSERNNKFHQNHYKTIRQLLKLLDLTVRNRISSIRLTNLLQPLRYLVSGSLDPNPNSSRYVS